MIIYSLGVVWIGEVDGEDSDAFGAWESMSVVVSERTGEVNGLGNVLMAAIGRWSEG
jgi:hypothetical protein